MELTDVLKEISSKEEEITAVYLYGSRVYGTSNELSDYDFIIVKKGTIEKKEIRNENINATIYTEEEFEAQLKEHEISALECLYLPDTCKWLEKKSFHIEINKEKLRESISKKASNSWVKAKKKLMIEEDFNPYIAKKSLFHSFRILSFGTQIATYGRIIDFQEANFYWREIHKFNSIIWNDYQNTFQKEYNRLKSIFKKAAPKE